MLTDRKTLLKEAYDSNAHLREKSELQEWKIGPRLQFLQLLKTKGKETLLEIGAGHGRDSKFFLENGLTVTAVDLSTEMVKLCREKGIEAHELDFYNLHSLQQTFDAVWAMNCLLHVEKSNLPVVLQGIRDVLKPAGLFFLGVYGGEDSEGIFEEDIYLPHRFFSFFTDEGIKAVVLKFFALVDFQRIETGGKYHFQALILQKK